MLGGEEYSPIRGADLEDSVQISCGIFKTLMLLCLRIKIVFQVVTGRIIITETPLGIGSHGKKPQVSSSDIKTWDGPVFKVVVGIAPDREYCELLPCVVHLSPRRLGSVSVKPRSST